MTNFVIDPKQASVATPVTLRCRVTAERDIFVRQYRGEPIGSLPELHVPGAARHLRTLAIDSAKSFIRDMGTQGYLPLSEPGDMKLFGPYQSRGFGTQPLSAKKAVGWHMFEDPHPESGDFVLEGRFLATRVVVTESPLTLPEGHRA